MATLRYSLYRGGIPWAIELADRPVQMEFWGLGARRHMLGLEKLELETKPGCRIWFPGLSVRHPYPADWQEGDRKHFLDAAIFQKLYLLVLPGSSTYRNLLSSRYYI